MFYGWLAAEAREVGHPASKFKKEPIRIGMRGWSIAVWKQKKGRGVEASGFK